MPTGKLPASGKKVWEEVYNKALKGSCKGDKECAARTAWSAVKGSGWSKDKEGNWRKKSEAIAEMSMFITKTQIDNKGIMRWMAVNSDTDPDSYEERMSLELYQDFLEYIRNKEPVPEIFKSVACSDYWCGGMPYVSVSHYPDLNGTAVPGSVLELFIDGNKLKAKGILKDTPLGNSVYRSLKEDNIKPPQDKIRISIGFLDLAHKHGDGELWVRDSLYSLCPECLEGVGDKVYVKGYLVHLALTRVPVNKRTKMILADGLEEKSMAAKKKTRKEDAASIIGKDLAEEIDAKNKASALRSDALIEMSEGEEPTAEETQELIEEVEASAPEVVETPETEAPETEKSDVEPEEVELFEVKADSNGGYLVADRGDGKPALPTKQGGKLSHRLMGAAWAALHDGYRGNKYEGKGKEEAIAKLKRLYKKEGIPTPSEKSDFEDDSVELKDMGMDMGYNMPYGGATSMKEAEQHKKAKDEMIHVMDMWSMFSNVAWNIMDRSDITDKKAAFVKALDEFKSMLSAKAMLEFGMVEKSEAPEHELQPAIDALLGSVDNSVELSDAERGEIINPALQELGTAIMDYLQKKSVKAETPAPDKNNDNLLESIKQLIQPLSDGVQELRTEVGVLKAKSNAQNVEVQKPRIPQPRTLQSSVIKKAETEKPKVGSLRSIINKSVGIEE